jgi:hypothetical protein
MTNPAEMEHRVTLQQAAAMTAAYRAREQAKGTVLGGRFSRPIIDAILAQTGCSGLRYYFGETPTGELTVVLLGVDPAHEDIWQGVLAEVSWPCPPICPAANPLNSNR